MQADIPLIDRGSFKVYQCEQGTPEWWIAKCGVPSASDFCRILTPKTGKLSAQADDYINELVADSIVQDPNYFTSQGKPVTWAMQQGIDTEPEARRFYEMERKTRVDRVGFVLSYCGRYGCSPDGLTEDGGLELKCPLLKTQIGYLRAGELPDDYRTQVHGALVVTGAPWWDFLSYHPRTDPLLIRVKPDEFTDKLRNALDEFCQRLAAVRKHLIRQ